MTKIEKRMIAGVIFCLIVLGLFVYQLNRTLQPLAANIEKNGVKPYVMQLWEGKK